MAEALDNWPGPRRKRRADNAGKPERARRARSIAARLERELDPEDRWRIPYEIADAEAVALFQRHAGTCREKPVTSDG